MKRYDDIFLLTQELDKTNVIQWTDAYGKIDFLIKENGNINQICNWKKTKYIIADYLNLNINKHESKNIEQIISIGGFFVHNQGKIEAQKNKVPLITIPLPLSNDSFGTNRCSSKNNNENIPSYEGVYPSKCIFLVEELLKLGINQSILGIGEFIGLYYSVIDYYLKKKLIPDTNILTFINQLFFEITHSFSQNNTLCLKKIVQGLVFKNLIMRISNDHEIGCGIDHFFARVYERKYGYNHGKAVYLGAIISSFLLPEWAKFGLDTNVMIDCGLLLTIISKDDITNICNQNLPSLVKEALDVRKSRDSMLRYLSETDIANKHKVFKNGIYQTYI
jgi:glycerol-1-phosphate dehydrogenase [NAD(P)+]